MPLTLSHWGASEVEVRDGAIVAIRPAPGDPDPSPIAENLRATVDHPVRIRRPAARRGWLEDLERGRGRGARRAGWRRGAEPFVELGWDEALDLAAAELDRVRREHGNEAIFAGSYGWASAGRFHQPQPHLHRLLNLVGGFTSSVGSYSYAAAEVIVTHLIGGDFRQVLGRHTSFEQLAAHGRLLVALGGLPAKNQQVENGGSFHHLAPEGLRGLRDAGVELVSISPLRGDTEAELGAEWWPIRPGTDVALLLALGHTLVEAGRHDRAFLDRYCRGADRFVDYLLGRGPAGGPPRSADWAAPICGLDAERIRALAHRMADGPTMVTASWSLQRADFGEQVYAATIALAALLGQIGTPGGGFGLGYGSVNRVGSAQPTFALARVPGEPNPVATWIPVARITDLLERTEETTTFDGQTLFLPDVRLLYWAGGNPFHHHQDLNRLVAAWQRPDTVIVHEQAWNPLARRADLVFPVTTTLERDDIGTAPLTGALVAMPRLLDPPGSARDDYAVLVGLAERLGVADRFTAGRDTTGWLEWLWTESSRRGRSEGIDLPPLEDLWRKGVVELPRPPRPRVLLGDFRSDPEAHPLATPSGRIELCSDTLAGYELPDCPPHATWFEPEEWLGSARTERFPLHLLSNQPKDRLHSQLDYGATSRAGKVAGRAPVQLHPADAAARGIADGDVVRLYNDRGACLAGAVLEEGLRPGVAVLATGAWYDPLDPSVPGSLDVHGNPNVLTSARPASSLSGGPAPGSCLVEVERWDGPVPRVRAFDPPTFVEDPRPG